MIKLSLTLFFSFLFFQYKTETGLFVWNTFHRYPELTLILDRDAVLSMEIGGYYFNLRGDGEYDLEKAERYFEKALTLDSNVPDAWHNLARIDFLNGDFDNALYKINKQIEIHGDSFMASYYIRGLIYGFMGEFEKAEENFLVFLEWTPGNWAALNDLAWIYFQNEKYQKAADTARRALEFEYASNNPWLLNMYGLALFNMGEKENASALFERALSGAQLLTSADWELAYPGNDPRIAEQGLAEMISAIEFNKDLALVD